jgi:hypothetical protein
MKLKSPASGKRQGLDNDFGESNSSTLKLKKSKGINHIRILNEIATKWVAKGYYSTSGRALEALIGGRL